jgi:ABC-2 type transport system ATP-binding protein
MLALAIHQLKKTYENGFEALKGIDLKVEQGDFFALLGANGAGKSTTISIISDLVQKTSGDILIQGYSLETQPQQAKANLGVVPQEFNLPVFETCEEVLFSVAGLYGISRRQARPRIDWLLDKLQLGPQKKSIVYQLSGGMKRRLMIARALIHQPKLLILDEPSAGVDIEIRHNIWAFLREINRLGTTIILTTHYLEEAEQLCNQVAIIHHGQILTQSSIQDLLASQTQHTYVFTSKQPIIARLNLDPWQIAQIDEFSFEVILPKEYSLNQVFAELLKLDIPISSVTHKTNRLEALFMEWIKK